MGRSLFKTVIASLLFAAVVLGGYSCSDDYPDDYLTEAQVRRMIEDALRENNQNLEFTQWKIVPFTVRGSDWSWDEEAKRYEAVYALPELTEFIYEEGANIGYVFIGQQDVNEVQKLLPYLHTYEAGIPYTETISYDIQYKTDGVVQPTVAFFIQASDLVRADEYLIDYNFRIVLVW